MTYKELIEYYRNLLILQYHDKQKAQETIELLISVLLPENESTGTLLNLDIKDAFNLDTATGVQLDIIGKYVGVDRFYQGQEFDDAIYFGMSDQFSTEPTDVTGYSDATDFLTKEGEFLSQNDVISQNNQLNDDDYRFIIKLKIIQNNINHSNQQIDDNLFDLFGTSLYMTDNENMTITYLEDGTLGALLTVIVEKEVLPKPMGVGINAIIPITTYFSLTDSNGVTTDDEEGFASASDFLTKDGTFISNSDIINV